jgi:F-type H+-transporting ATPase subunit epsilon
MSSIQVDVVSATESLYSGEAKCVFAPASTGELGIYPKHVALLSVLKPGEVRIETDTGVESIYNHHCCQRLILKDFLCNLA